MKTGFSLSGAISLIQEANKAGGWSGRHNSEDEIGVCRPEYHAGHPDKAGCDGDCEEVPADVVVLGKV